MMLPSVALSLSRFNRNRVNRQVKCKQINEPTGSTHTKRNKELFKQTHIVMCMMPSIEWNINNIQLIMSNLF